MEREKAEGKPIRELEIAEHLLMTREGNPVGDAVRPQRRVDGEV